MKCIYCAMDTNYKTRQANRGACNSCHRRFAFEPKAPKNKLTDMKFKGLLDAVSDRGSLRFTADHVRYEAARRKAAIQWLPTGIVVMIILFAIAFALMETSPLLIAAWLVAIPVVFGGLRWLASYRLRHATVGDVYDFRNLQSQWVQAHGAIPGLIRSQGTSSMIEAAIEPDPYYSFGRVVITDTRATAAMLLANKFHIENECAVLCIDGYPFSNWQDMVALLRTNPDLAIALVHDATPAGCALPSRIRQPGWFPEETFICVDAGLRPSQARALRLPVRQGPAIPVTLSNLDFLPRKDVTFLQRGMYSELTALTPRRLLTSITRNFTLLATARSDPEMAGTSNNASGSTWFFGSDGGAGEEETFG